jgi:hypothetical protein
VQRTKDAVRDLIWGGKWEKQVRPLSWLLERFWPVPGWTDADLAKLRGEPVLVGGAV